MKYNIRYLIKGEAGAFQQKLMQEVETRFDVHEARKTKQHTHISLKYSFQANDEEIQELENVLAGFCATTKAVPFKVKGFGHFDKDVIFLEITDEEAVRKVYNKFYKEIKKLPWLVFKTFDGKTHFHASIAHSDIKERFDAIWNHLQGYAPEFDMLFDNITITRFDEARNEWSMHKEFSLQS